MRVIVVDEIFDHVGKRISDGEIIHLYRFVFIHAKTPGTKAAKLFLSPLREK